ncbi:MAG: hypothetical protein ACFFAO_06645 [Candidatus Hermodarchaeota archaeon]
MSAIAEDIRVKMMNILKVEEEKTDLENLSVLSRVGMKIVSAFSTELDADAVSASSTALIDLGLRLAEATNHGALMEIVLHNNTGYCILMAVNDDYLVFGGLSKVYRIGYYLSYLRELVKKLNILISGGEISEMALSLQEEEAEKLRIQKEEEEAKAAEVNIPSVEQDKQAMDELLGFLDDWDKEEKEAMGIEDFEDLEADNIVSIPESMKIGLPQTGTSISIPEEEVKEISQESPSQFKIYEDEVPPVPLEDYTPMDVEEELASKTAEQPVEYAEPSQYPSAESNIPLEDLPSFDELSPPEFEESASEYDTKFVLEEESEALDSVLKDLGWEEEE